MKDLTSQVRSSCQYALLLLYHLPPHVYKIQGVTTSMPYWSRTVAARTGRAKGEQDICLFLRIAAYLLFFVPEKEK